MAPTRANASPKTITKEKVEKIPSKASNTVEARIRTNAVPKVLTPKKSKDNKVTPGTVTKSVKKATWKRRPKPAHSGVPVPEKMKKLFRKQLQDLDCTF